MYVCKVKKGLMTNTGEKQDIEMLRKGSIAAFDVLYNRYSGKLYGFVLSISNNDTYLAEEIVQCVFIKIWETREQINSEKSFVSFLYTIARNILMNSYQHQMVEYVYREFVQSKFSEAHSETEQEVEYRLLEELVDSIVERLPEGRKKVFVLSKKEYLSNKEVAKVLGISESTVEKQLAAALKFVREQLTKHYDKFFLLLFCLALSDGC